LQASKDKLQVRWPDSLQVPALWARAAYPSLKPLGSWVLDFGKRMAFIASWLTDGQPAAFWLPGLFFPQARHSRIISCIIEHVSVCMSPGQFCSVLCQSNGDFAASLHQKHCTERVGEQWRAVLLVHKALLLTMKYMRWAHALQQM
jgi:hypothetical protein